MAESEHSQENLAYVRTHVENIEQMSRFAIASNPNCSAFVKSCFEDKKGSAEIYLALSEGPKSQSELQKLTSQSQANVSKICKHLFQQGIIAKLQDPSKKGGILYYWGDLETLLKVSKIARTIPK